MNRRIALGAALGAPIAATARALNVDMPRGGEDTSKRRSIGRAILRELNALPAP